MSDWRTDEMSVDQRAAAFVAAFNYDQDLIAQNLFAFGHACAAAIDASWQERMRISLEDAAVLRGKLAAAERERDGMQESLLLSMRAIAVDGLGLLDPLSDDAPDQPPPEWHGLLSQKVAAIRAQRDALLAALREIQQLDDERVYDDVGNDMQLERFVVDSASAKRIAREAVAAAEGGA